jgi:hypothetical protein
MGGISTEPTGSLNQGNQSMKAPKPGKPKPKVKAVKVVAKRKKAA